jgi:hypothetical protein
MLGQAEDARIVGDEIATDDEVIVEAAGFLLLVAPRGRKATYPEESLSGLAARTNQGVPIDGSHLDSHAHDRKNCASGSASYAAPQSARTPASAPVVSMMSTRMTKSPPFAWGD